MGGGSYSSEKRSVRVDSMARDVSYDTAPVDNIFKQNKARKAHKLMNVKDIDVREARDSEEHPNSVPIIIALDVTGSMGHIPHHLIKEGLPKIVSAIMEAGIEHPQIMFMPFGDHECDSYALQAGQFESSDELMDTWLTRSYLEGGGGGNGGESYLLPWYFAANHTATDHWDKRQKRGHLITIGDEPNLPMLDQRTMKAMMNHSTLQSDISDFHLLSAAQEKWNVTHINIEHHRTGTRAKQWWGDRYENSDGLLVNTRDYQEVPKLIANLVIDVELSGSQSVQPEEQSGNAPTKPSEDTSEEVL